MDCAAKGMRTPCTGPATIRCGGCGAVSYCSSHQISHWKDHKEECGRLKKQMEQIDALSEFPFTFSSEVTSQVTSCSFLKSLGLHKVGVWMHVCRCELTVPLSGFSWRKGRWYLPKELCPCTDASNDLPKILSSWKEYYDWRCLPLCSPVALLLHLPLSIYYGIRLVSRGTSPGTGGELRIHYLGPEEELHQLPAFGELHALFPGFQVFIEIVGASIPQNWYIAETFLEGRTLLNNEVYYYRIMGSYFDGFPHYIIGANAGIAAYASWKPTIELIRDINVPAIFLDYCEEAANHAARCVSTVTGRSLSLPIQLNPFRQPFKVEDAALRIPCFSNCFLFGL